VYLNELTFSAAGFCASTWGGEASSSKYALSTRTFSIHSLALAGFLGNGGASVLFNKLASPLGGAAVLDLSNEVRCKCIMGNGCSYVSLNNSTKCR